jgi:radical SAM protein with 4Fe4S-binding SPASM domain
MVLTPTNISQAILLAKLGKKLGVDYLVIKQCSDTVKGDIGVYNKLSKYSEFTPILEEAERISVNFGYQVIIKWKALMNEGRINYPKCLGAPFLLYSSGDGKLYSCGGFFTKNEYMLGDLTKQSFLSIIKSKRYHDMISNINMKYCYTNCKTHSINKYLNSLTNPPKHVNFI